MSSTDSHLNSQLSLLRLNEEKALTEQLSQAEDAYQEIAADIGTLIDDMKEHAESADDIKEMEDTQVRIAMKELNDWKKKKQGICKAYRKQSSLVDKLVKSLEAEISSDSGRRNASQEIETLKADREDLQTKYDEMDEFVDGFLDQLRSEDSSRSLHSRDTEKLSEVEWPRFTGKESEDFAKFREKLEKAFKHAKTSRDAKVDKLRSLLSGHAKDLVPDSVRDLDTAYKALADAFGDPSRLVDFKLKLLNDAGILPAAERKGYRAQVSFYLKLQGIVEDLIALGTQSDDLGLHAFHRSSMHALANRFPTNLRTKLILKHSKSKGKDQLEGMLATIKTWREEAQVLESADCEITSKRDVDPQKQTVEKKNLKVHVVAPFKMNDCLICKELQQRGEKGDL